MPKDAAPGLPIIRSVEVPGSGKLVVMRQDAFRTAVRAANRGSRVWIPGEGVVGVDQSGRVVGKAKPPARR